LATLRKPKQSRRVVGGGVVGGGGGGGGLLYVMYEHRQTIVFIPKW